LLASAPNPSIVQATNLNRRILRVRRDASGKVVALLSPVAHLSPAMLPTTSRCSLILPSHLVAHLSRYLNPKALPPTSPCCRTRPNLQAQLVKLTQLENPGCLILLVVVVLLSVRLRLCCADEITSHLRGKLGLGSSQEPKLAQRKAAMDQRAAMGDELLNEFYTLPVHRKRGGREKRKQRSRCRSKRYIKAKRVGKQYVTLS